MLRGFCVSALALLASAGLPAAAGEGYFGVAAGASVITQDFGVFELDAIDPAWKLYGGFRATRLLGVEFGYNDLGSPSTSFEGGSTVEVAEVEITGAYATLVGYLTVGKFDLFGKGGLYRSETKLRAVETIQGLPDPIPRSSDDDSFDPLLGIGAGLTFERIGVRVELEYFDVDGLDRVFLLSGGVDFRF